MNKINKAIKQALKQKSNFAVGELYVNVSAFMGEKIDMKEFAKAYNQVKHESK